MDAFPGASSPREAKSVDSSELEFPGFLPSRVARFLFATPKPYFLLQTFFKQLSAPILDLSVCFSPTPNHRNGVQYPQAHTYSFVLAEYEFLFDITNEILFKVGSLGVYKRWDDGITFATLFTSAPMSHISFLPPKQTPFRDLHTPIANSTSKRLL